MALVITPSPFYAVTDPVVQSPDTVLTVQARGGLLEAAGSLGVRERAPRLNHDEQAQIKGAATGTLFTDETTGTVMVVVEGYVEDYMPEPVAETAIERVYYTNVLETTPIDVPYVPPEPDYYVEPPAPAYDPYSNAPVPVVPPAPEPVTVEYVPAEPVIIDYAYDYLPDGSVTIAIIWQAEDGSVFVTDGGVL